MADLTTEEGRLAARQQGAARAARDMDAAAGQPGFLQKGLDVVRGIFKSPAVPSIMAPTGDLADVQAAPQVPAEEQPDFAAMAAGQGPVRAQPQAPEGAPSIQAQTSDQAAAQNDPARLVGQRVNPAELGPVEASAEYGKNYALQAGANTLRGGADFVGALDGLAGMVARKAGIAKPQIMAQLEDSALYWAQNMQNRMSFQDYMTTVVGGVLGSAPEVVQFMMGPEWAALRAVGQGEDLPGAITAYAQRAAAGSVFKAAHTLDAPGRIAAGTAYMTGENAASQLGATGTIDPGQLAEAAGTGLGMMLTGGIGPGNKSGLRQRTDPRGWIETSPVGRELERAYAAGEIDTTTKDLAYDFMTSDLARGGTAFRDTTLNVVDTVRLIKKGVDDAILREQGIDPATASEGQHIVTGKATVRPQKDGTYQTAIELYQGHGVDTLIEEWMHRQFYYLDGKERGAVQKAYDAYSGSLKDGEQPMSIEEFYAKGATDKYFADLYASHKAAQRPAFTRAMDAVRERWGNIVDAVKGIPGAKVDELGSQAVREGSGIEFKTAEHYQSAYHGSPYRFDKFTLDHIGSGEGAQAYGWGLYFAGNRQVGEYYRESLAKGAKIDIMEPLSAQPEVKRALERYAKEIGDYSYHPDEIGLDITGSELYDYLHTLEGSHQSTGRLLEKIGLWDKGQLYEVTIPDDHTMLDWDKPLSEQPEQVKKALGDVIDLWVQRTAPEDFEGARERLMDSMTGQYLYNFDALWKAVDEAGGFSFEGDKSVSEYLKSIGIPGLRYLDGTSRSKGEGHHNYVVFDDAQIAIDKTYYQVRDLSEIAREISATDVPLPKYAEADNLNLTKIQGQEDILRMANALGKRMAASIEAERGGVQGWETTQALADDLGMTVEGLLARRQGQPFAREELLAARGIMAQALVTMNELRLKATGPNATDAARLDVMRFFDVYEAIKAQVSGMTAEAGRILNIMGKPLDLEQAGPGLDVGSIGGLMDKAVDVDAEFQRYGGRDRADRIIQGLATLSELAADGKVTVRQLSKYVSDARKATTADMLMEAWINSLLMGPATHIVNSASNLSVAMWALPERALAGAIGAARDKLGRVKDGDRVYIGEALAQAYGAYEGMKDGLRLAGRAWLRGESADPMGKVETVRRAITAENLGIDPADPFGKALDWMASLVTDGPAPAGVRRAARSVRNGMDVAFDHVLRGPTRALMAEDEFFKAVGYRMELRAQAYRQAASEGLRGQEFNARVQELTDNPTVQIKLASTESARYQTFTNALGEIGNALMSMKQATYPIETAGGSKFDVPVGLPISVVVPFVRTPANVIKYGLARTPLGLTMPSVWSDILAGGAKSDLAIARLTLGSTLAAGFAAMAAQGVITGGGPTDHKQRENLQQTGWLPYSFKIGDKYYQYKRFDPLSTVIGFAADFAQMQEWMAESDKENLAALISTSFAQNVLDRSWMMGVQRALDALADPQRHGDRWIQQTVGGFLPAGAGLRAARAAQDPYLREVESVVDAWKNQIPGYSTSLYPRRDRYGEPVKAGEYWLAMQGVSPVRTSQDQTEDRSVTAEADRIIRDNHVSIPGVNKNFHADGVFVPLTGEEHDRLQQIAGQETSLVDNLNRLVASPQFQRMSDGPDGTKAQAIRQVFSEARERARDMLYRESVGVPGGLAERLEEAKALDRLKKSAQQQ